MLKRTVQATMLASVLLLGSAGAALGHECIISSRSEQGNAGATNSKVWTTLTTEQIFGFIHFIVDGDPLSHSQITWAVAAADAAGIPDSFVVRSDKTIGGGSANPNLADGKGLDHLSALYGPQIVGIYFAALSQ